MAPHRRGKASFLSTSALLPAEILLLPSDLLSRFALAVLGRRAPLAPCGCSTAAFLGAVAGRVLLRHKALLAALEQTEPRAPSDSPLTSRRFRRCSLRAHGRACSRRVKSRGGGATPFRGVFWGTTIPRLLGSAVPTTARRRHLRPEPLRCHGPSCGRVQAARANLAVP